MYKLQLDNVCHQVRSNNGQLKQILKNISMQVDKGSVVTLVGPSGSGKSTLLTLINRLQELSSGSIYLDDQSIVELEVLQLRRQVGMLMQQPFMFTGTVAANIAYGPALVGENVNVNQLLQLVGLGAELAQQEAATLSGGQKQRVALARTLANGPELLLLDEPTSALDPQSITEIEELVKSLSHEGLTVIWVTHNLEQAQRMGNYTGLIKAGELVAYKPTPEFFAGSNPEVNKFIEGDL